MKLRYIAISLAYDYPTSKEYRYEFECHSSYICNFLSKAIRKYKIEVEETYNMILIALGNCHKYTLIQSVYKYACHLISHGMRK